MNEPNPPVKKPADKTIKLLNGFLPLKYQNNQPFLRALEKTHPQFYELIDKAITTVDDVPENFSSRTGFLCRFSNNVGALSGSLFNLNKMSSGLFVGEGPENSNKSGLLLSETYDHPEQKIDMIVALGEGGKGGNGFSFVPYYNEPTFRERSMAEFFGCLTKDKDRVKTVALIFQNLQGECHFHFRVYQHPETGNRGVHLHFPTWPDNDLPEAFSDKDLYVILLLVRLSSLNILFHCKAGLGRSASLALLVKLMREQSLNVDDKVKAGENIWKAIHSFRQMRPGCLYLTSQLWFTLDLIKTIYQFENSYCNGRDPYAQLSRGLKREREVVPTKKNLLKPVESDVTSLPPVAKKMKETSDTGIKRGISEQTRIIRNMKLHPYSTIADKISKLAKEQLKILKSANSNVQTGRSLTPHEVEVLLMPRRTEQLRLWMLHIDGADTSVNLLGDFTCDAAQDLEPNSGYNIS